MTPSVRAKFFVTDIEENTEDGSATITLAPVVGGSSENDSFYKYTPGGSISLSTINAAAARQFQSGKEYYVDFTPAS
jgi:hypothetical protein